MISGPSRIIGMPHEVDLFPPFRKAPYLLLKNITGTVKKAHSGF